MFEAFAKSRAGGSGNSWVAFVIANLVTAAVVLPAFVPIRAFAASELAPFFAFVVTASVATKDGLCDPGCNDLR